MELHRDLTFHGIDTQKRPMMFQINKRDLPRTCSVDSVRRHFQAEQAAYIESIATDGVGVNEAMDALVRFLIDNPDQKSLN